jgi:hypothetical protein
MTHHALKTANEHVNTYKQAHSHDDMWEGWEKKKKEKPRELEFFDSRWFRHVIFIVFL